MSEFVYRRLYQMQWRCTRPAREDRREEDKAKTQFVEGLAKAAVNGYSCFGEMRHPGCARRCPYDAECGVALLVTGDRSVVIVEEQ